MRCAVPITWLLRGGGPGCCPLAAAAAHRGCSSRSSLTVLGERYAADRWTNVTERVLSRLGRCLHRRPRHPLQLLRRRIENHFYVSYATPSGVPLFATFDDLPPVVTTEQSFDSLLIAADHPSRSPTDTYYINERLLLRPQTSAHQVVLPVPSPRSCSAKSPVLHGRSAFLHYLVVSTSFQEENMKSDYLWQ